MKIIVFAIVCMAAVYGMFKLLDWANEVDPSEYREQYKRVGY
jgi:hypothetical protein